MSQYSDKKARRQGPSVPGSRSFPDGRKTELVNTFTSAVVTALQRPASGGTVAVVGVIFLVLISWLYFQIPGPPPPPDKSGEMALQSSLKEVMDRVDSQQKSLQEFARQVAKLGQELKAEREFTQNRFLEVSGRVAEAIRQRQAVPVQPPAVVTTAPAAPATEGLAPPSPAMNELILLKERNRLTDYADKAIATGSRDALQALVEAMFDPERQTLHHAAQAEFRRVQAFFEISSSIDPGYKLPLLELFKDHPVQSEADLKPAQLMTLMKDTQHPWEVRLRCAYLLRENPDASVNAALLKALKEDPSLDVAKQAQTSLERRLGKRFRLFDIPAVEAWIQAHPPSPN